MPPNILWSMAMAMPRCMHREASGRCDYMTALRLRTFGPNFKDKPDSLLMRY